MGLLDPFLDIFDGKRLRIERRFEKLDRGQDGSVSQVFKVRDKRSSQISALKICDAGKLRDYRVRFEKLALPTEGEMLQCVKSPRVVQYLDAGETVKHEYFLLMEYAEGQPLNVVLRYYNAQLVGKRVGLLRQMAEAVAAVHQAGLLHRDICPENFIVSPDQQQVKAIDFNLAVPRNHDFITPGIKSMKTDYIAPETMSRRFTDLKLDVYSFGVTAYQLLANRMPWEPSRDASTIVRAMRQPIDIRKHAANIPEAVARAVMDCLQSDPDDRTPTLERFMEQLPRLEY